MRAINQDKQLYVGGVVEMSEEDFQNLRNLARAEAAFFDEWLGRLLAYLEKRRLLDNTIVVITSDHGDNFGEHGLIRHGLCLYETLLHVPLIIRPPGQKVSVRVPQMVQLIDLLPTLMGLASIAEPQVTREFQGHDLLQAIQTGEFSKYVISELYRPTTGLFEKKVPDFMPEFRAKYDRVLRSYRTEKYKLIWSSNGLHELYDLEKDPGEEHNIHEDEASIASDLHDRLQGWLASFPHAHHESVITEESVDDERVLERLRDLGYIE
jgi:arylsulfatase A-like enzyme